MGRRRCGTTACTGTGPTITQAWVDPTGTNGNTSADPRLAAAAHGNNHIQSPIRSCLDAGDDGVIQLDWVDMDGQPRKQGARVDIGADESDGTVWTDGPLAIVRVSPNGN